MIPTWTRNERGWYQHKNHPRLLVINPKFQDGWLVMCLNRDGRRQTVGHYRVLADAKYAVIHEGRRWEQAT